MLFDGFDVFLLLLILLYTKKITFSTKLLIPVLRLRRGQQ